MDILIENRLKKSKIFASSNRKADILASFEDPINKELVSQLYTALDEEYRLKENLTKPEQVSEESDDIEEDGEQDSTDTNAPAKKGGSGSKSKGKSSGGSTGSVPNGANVKGDPFGDNREEPEDEPDDTDTDAEPVEESEDLDKEDITAVDEEIDIVEEPIEEELVELTESPAETTTTDVQEEIKDLLNRAEETDGVSRLQEKDSELWIFYNDDVNLNDKMAAVIDALMTPYRWLEFNRLARSNNAIVFITNEDIVVPDPPVTEIEEPFPGVDEEVVENEVLEEL